MSAQYVLLYSKHCMHSEKFIKDLYKDQNIYNLVKKQCIDNCSFKIPSTITVVPALIVKSNGRFDTFQGKEVFDWLEQMRDSFRTQQTYNEQNVSDGISCYDPVTMNNSLSDSFSNLNDERPMSHCYQFLNQTEGFTGTNMNINTPSTNTLDSFKDDSSKKLEALIANTNMDIPNPPSRQ